MKLYLFLTCNLSHKIPDQTHKFQGLQQAQSQWKMRQKRKQRQQIYIFNDHKYQIYDLLCQQSFDFGKQNIKIQMNKTDRQDRQIEPLHFTPQKNQRLKRFTRKPSEKSDRSLSKKSDDFSWVKQSYIKTPVNSKNKFNPKSDDLLKCFGSTVLTGSERKHFSSSRKLNSEKNSSAKLQTLEAEIDLKNHEATILTNECERYKSLYESEKEKRRKVEIEKRENGKELKEALKQIEKLKVEIKKINKQKQYLSKQIEFLQRINYDEKTRNMQSYREKYLESQLTKYKTQLKKSKGEKQCQLQKELKIISQSKYTLQAHYKALKVANQCLLKQVSSSSENLTQFVLQSDEYTKLRQKYIKFLEEYKKLRHEYWSLKTQVNAGKNDSSLFSITVSQQFSDQLS